METSVAVVLLAGGGLALVRAIVRPPGKVRAGEAGVARKAAGPSPPPADVEGVWARHPLEADRGWYVAATVPWPIDPGDRIRVRRRDGSESVETVRRVLLELREPDGNVVGHLVEVEEG